MRVSSFIDLLFHFSTLCIIKKDLSINLNTLPLIKKCRTDDQINQYKTNPLSPIQKATVGYRYPERGHQKQSLQLIPKSAWPVEASHHQAVAHQKVGKKVQDQPT